MCDCMDRIKENNNKRRNNRNFHYTQWFNVENNNDYNQFKYDEIR